MTPSFIMYDLPSRKILRTVYDCTYTKNTDELPRYRPLVATEQGARAHAKPLIIEGDWGAIARHREWKPDAEHASVLMHATGAEHPRLSRAKIFDIFRFSGNYLS